LWIDWILLLSLIRRFCWWSAWLEVSQCYVNVVRCIHSEAPKAWYTSLGGVLHLRPVLDGSRLVGSTLCLGTIFGAHIFRAVPTCTARTTRQVYSIQIFLVQCFLLSHPCTKLHASKSFVIFHAHLNLPFPPRVARHL
jgi:hypothetical protein